MIYEDDDSLIESITKEIKLINEEDYESFYLKSISNMIKEY